MIADGESSRRILYERWNTAKTRLGVMPTKALIVRKATMIQCRWGDLFDARYPKELTGAALRIIVSVRSSTS